MKASTVETSCSAAGRMVTMSVLIGCRGSPGWILPRALQSLGDAGDACEECLEQIAIPAVARAPALQQVHLHQVHGIDVGIAQLYRSLQRRVRVEERAAVLDGEHMFAGGGVLVADVDK